MNIILRKVHGRLEALLSTPTRSFGTGVPAISVAGLASPLMLGLVTVLLAVAAVMAIDAAAPLVAALPDAHDLIGPGLAFAVGRTAIEEKQEQIVAKSAFLDAAFKHAGDTLDFAKADVLTHLGVKDSAAAVAKVRELNRELEDLGKERDGLVELATIQQAIKDRTKTPVNAVPHPDGGSGKDTKRLSIGEAIVGSAAFKRFKESKSPSEGIVEGFGLAELKTLFETGAGWSPETTRIPGLLIEKATRPIQLLDIIPSARTGQAAVVYMEETTRTHAAAERAEGAAYAEDAFALTERSETVRSIGSSIPVTDEQLEDVEQAQSYLNQRMMFGLRQRLDGQVLIGNGTPPNLTGIKNKAGIQTQAKGTDPTPDAVYKAMVKVRVTGRAFPNAVVFHPTDWQNVRLLRTADGIYIWGSPAEAGPERIWGNQVVQSDADSAGTAYVGDFANFCALYERRGTEVAVGYVGDQFKEGKKTIRAGMRVAFAIYRAAAFCSVTGL